MVNRQNVRRVAFRHAHTTAHKWSIVRRDKLHDAVRTFQPIVGDLLSCNRPDAVTTDHWSIRSFIASSIKIHKSSILINVNIFELWLTWCRRGRTWSSSMTTCCLLLLLLINLSDNWSTNTLHFLLLIIVF